ncbi:MAG: formylmethanofuran dehydrogenase subunit B, partial [Candidatus Bathyarchaeia archaeon]
MPSIITDVVCPYCGCLCDDLEVVVESGKILEVRSNCELGAEKFLHAHAPTRLKTPKIKGDGGFKEVSLDEAVQKAAEVLMNAKKPLVYGWSSTECEAIRVGVELTEEVGGIIDDTSSVCHGPTIIALQDVGISTCTLGEIKNRADLIIYWGCNPMQAHPRHLSRYTFFPRGFFRARGQEERALVVVDVRATETSRLAKHFLQVKPNYDYELVSALRMAIKGHKIPDKVGGVPREKIEEVASLMKKSKFV